MSNCFHSGEDHCLNLSNSATAVFVDVLTLAVAELAREPWDFRFASLLTLQNQDVMGRGAVGFDLAELDWGATAGERAAAKGFLLRVLDLALARHRWEELSYVPGRAEGHLGRYREMVAAFDPASAREPGQRVLPGPEEAASACCVRHRVLDALPFWEACVFCTSEG